LSTPRAPEIENELLPIPRASEAAVIGVASARWSERPLGCVVLQPGGQRDADELCTFLCAALPRWKVPDRFVFVTEIPKSTSTP
jgi:fatty-acyl-CoA synthase